MARGLISCAKEGAVQTPNSLDEAIKNGLSDYSSRSDKPDSAAPIICQHVKDFIRQKLSPFFLTEESEHLREFRKIKSAILKDD